MKIKKILMFEGDLTTYENKKISMFEGDLTIYENKKILMFEGNLTTYDQKFVSSDNPVQKNWQKVGQSDKIAQDKEIFISPFP